MTPLLGAKMLVLGISLVSYNMPRGLSDDCLIFSGNGKRR